MAKRKKKEIVPGNASKKRREEAMEKAKPQNKFNIPKSGWWGLVALEAILLLTCFFTGNLIFGLPAVVLAFFIEHNGMDVLLEDYNEMMADRRERLGLPRDPEANPDENLSDTMRRERIEKRREKKERKIAENMGLSYEDYLEAARLGEEREARKNASSNGSDSNALPEAVESEASSDVAEITAAESAGADSDTESAE